MVAAIVMVVVASIALLGVVCSWLYFRLHTQPRVRVDVVVKSESTDKRSCQDALGMAERLRWGTHRAHASIGRCSSAIEEAEASTADCSEPHAPQTTESLQRAHSESEAAKASLANVEVGARLLPDLVNAVARARSHTSAVGSFCLQ